VSLATREIIDEDDAAGWRLGLFVALYARGVRTENFVSFVSRFGSDVVVLAAALAQAGHQLRAQPLCEMCLARGQMTAACICDHVEPHGGDWNRFWLTLPASSSLPIALR
jgi:hypothetical protein